MLLGVMRVQFADSQRVQVTQVSWKEIDHTEFAPYLTTASVIADDTHDFDALVAASRNLLEVERQARLANACRRPASTHVVSTAFLRNPDVVAAVLFRAVGICEK